MALLQHSCRVVEHSTQRSRFHLLQTEDVNRFVPEAAVQVWLRSGLRKRRPTHTLSSTLSVNALADSDDSVTAANRISRCITDVRAWLLLNNLMLNMDKTEAIVISAVNTRAHATVDVVIDVCGCVVTPAPYVRDIGVWFDSAMSMAKNVSCVCQMAYCQLRSIARIRSSITTAACRTIVHALVMSRLDYCNAILYGLPDAQLLKLQLVQNSAARQVTGTRIREHITPVLFALHWLPIRQRIQFKLLLLVYL